MNNSQFSPEREGNASNHVGSDDPSQHDVGTAPETAGAFDIRNIIALPLGIFGILLLFAYFVIDPGINPDSGDPKNASYNLITGMCLVLAAVVFALWAKLSPIRVDAEAARIREEHHKEMEAQREQALAQFNQQVAGKTPGKGSDNSD